MIYIILAIIGVIIIAYPYLKPKPNSNLDTNSNLDRDWYDKINDL
jgi:hypothetical protein